MVIDDLLPKSVQRPTRAMVENYLDCLIADYVFYDATTESLGKLRGAIRTADFMGYNVKNYYSIWQELAGELNVHQRLQSETLKKGEIDND